MVEQETLIQFTITEDSILTWQSIIKKLYELPRVGFKQMFNVHEFAMIDAIAELSHVEKGKDVTVGAENTFIRKSPYDE